jgi:hypothetical protein
VRQSANTGARRVLCELGDEEEEKVELRARSVLLLGVK